MILCLADLLAADAVAELRRLTAGAREADGRETAGWHARRVKRNRQLAKGAATAAAGAIVERALLAHPVFRAGVLPLRLRAPLFARYAPGMAYGTHVDDALMGEAPPLRTDVSVTLFLSDPADYDGGELVIETAGGETDDKLAAGAVVTYPATSLHRVAPVTRGERRVAVTWVQSAVRSAERREILFDLDRARRALFQASGKTTAFDLLAKSYANLLRLWAEP